MVTRINCECVCVCTLTGLVSRVHEFSTLGGRGGSTPHDLQRTPSPKTHTRYYYYFSIHITVAPEIKIRDYSVNNMISSEERSSSVMNERTVRSHHVKSREMLLRKYSRVKYELSMAHKNTLIPWCELVFGINQTDYMKRCV